MQQWIYTTSCWNISGRGGWGTFSHSKGLTEQEVRELEERCQVPSNIGPEFFPVFQMLTLASGKHVVCQTALQGNSFYDGRPGATISHAMILEKGEQWPVPPVQYIGSEDFWPDLPEQLKERALYYRDHPAEVEPPPYLPEGPVEKLHPGRDYTPEAIQEALQTDRRFSCGVSAVLVALLNTDAANLPVRYSCAPGKQAKVLAAVYYLLPAALQDAACASLFRTSGGMNQYSFLTLTGTRDSNAQVDVDSACGPVHPIVETAARNLMAWSRFCLVNNIQLAGVESRLAMFRFLYVDREAPLDSNMAAALADWMEAGLPLETAAGLGARLSDVAGVDLLPADLLVRIASRTADMYGGHARDFNDGQRKDWQSFIVLLFQLVTQRMMTGNITVDSVEKLLASHSFARETWVTDHLLAPELGKVPQGGDVLPVFILRLRLNPDISRWMRDSSGRILCCRCCARREFWSELLRAVEPGVLLEVWDYCLRLLPESGSKEEMAGALVKALEEQPGNLRGELVRMFMEKGDLDMASDCYIGADWPDSVENLQGLTERCRADGLDRLLERVVVRSLIPLMDKPCSVGAGQWLLEVSGEFSFEYEYQAGIADFAARGFKPDGLTVGVLEYAGRLKMKLDEYAIQHSFPVLDLVAGLDAYLKIPGVDRSSADGSRDADTRGRDRQSYIKEVYCPECLRPFLQQGADGGQEKEHLPEIYLGAVARLFKDDLGSLLAVLRVMEEQRGYLDHLLDSMLSRDSKKEDSGICLLVAELLYMSEHDELCCALLNHCACVLGQRCGKRERKAWQETLLTRLRQLTASTQAENLVLKFGEMMAGVQPDSLFSKILSIFGIGRQKQQPAKGAGQASHQDEWRVQEPDQVSCQVSRGDLGNSPREHTTGDRNHPHG